MVHAGIFQFLCSDLQLQIACSLFHAASDLGSRFVTVLTGMDLDSASYYVRNLGPLDYTPLSTLAAAAITTTEEPSGICMKKVPKLYFLQPNYSHEKALYNASIGTLNFHNIRDIVLNSL